MRSLAEIANKPLGRLLQAVNTDVFSRPPQTVGLRDLQRGMADILNKMRVNGEYRVLTSRGAPTFLLIPLDATLWPSLLAAAPPEIDFEREKARAQERKGEPLPDLDTVLRDAGEYPTRQ